MDEGKLHNKALAMLRRDADGSCRFRLRAVATSGERLVWALAWVRPKPDHLGRTRSPVDYVVEFTDGMWSCSCPDSLPCAHAYALWYVLGESAPAVPFNWGGWMRPRVVDMRA